jgi:hypothetical protein
MNQPDDLKNTNNNQQPDLPSAQDEPTIKETTSYSSNWALGLSIVVIGGLLLARNLGVDLFFLHFHNWWAFFILLAAISPLQQAFSFYRKNGMGAPVLNSLASAGAIVFISLIFLLDLSFSTWWPVFIILCGVYVMSSRNRV